MTDRELLATMSATILAWMMTRGGKEAPSVEQVVGAAVELLDEVGEHVDDDGKLTDEDSEDDDEDEDGGATY